ncbi:helix-turn-helix domain-containing protein [Dactylosporangium sp. AC04546]|uniref:helix-turn-helix domain-containing protein n=1 Tax=Dactylosporangium sp. AC04546 TaxID=2862460 RepID=UPI001EE0C257|nr:helix-turn-helix domain-containing protein [Dactylosporangium sp. AC04546]WVK80124.1 helix-turn-helix domain-containing protein [Dactylosporangium sp. AC04546]
MAVILDTSALPPRERIEALRSVLVDATAPSTVGLAERLDDGRPVAALVEFWQIGAIQAVRTESSHGLSLTRSPKQVRQGCGPLVSFAVQERNLGRQEQFGLGRAVPVGTLTCTDLTEPYHFSWGGPGAGRALQIPVDELALPPDVIRRAAPNLLRSPLYELVAVHVAAITRDPERLSDERVAAGVGRSSVELARAVLLSAAGEERHPAAADTLPTQIRAYIRQHLGDPELGANSIAAALNISTRRLYSVCAAAEFSVEQWIISQRLDAARADLADPANDHRTVATIARRHGFRDPAHFARRFRAAFGVTPRDWRNIAAGR